MTDLRMNNDGLPDLKIKKARDYPGLYYIEGAPFRISFWTDATDIDELEGQRRMSFARALVRAWNTRKESAALELLGELETVLDEGHSYESEGMARDCALKVVARYRGND